MKVIKIGGARGTDLSFLIEDLRNQNDYILVHGGSNEMNRLSEELGKPPKTLVSPSGHVSRYTDNETLDILRMAYSGLVNKRLVEELRAAGINALGLTGLDGGLLKGTRKKALRSVEEGRTRIIRDDNSGKTEEVNTDLLELLMSKGYVPVITIPICSEEGRALNADADRIAATIASAIHADDLVLLTNKPGLLRNPEDPSSIISMVNTDSMTDAMDAAQGRMKKKVLAAKEALEGGVSRVVISDANSEDPVKKALSGKGTVFS